SSQSSASGTTRASTTPRGSPAGSRGSRTMPTGSSSRRASSSWSSRSPSCGSAGARYRSAAAGTWAWFRTASFSVGRVASRSPAPTRCSTRTRTSSTPLRSAPSCRARLRRSNGSRQPHGACIAIQAAAGWPGNLLAWRASSRSSPMSRSSSTRHSAANVQSHFRRKALALDSLYDESSFVQRRVRPGLLARRDIALDVVDSYSSPSVLAVACGSGRIGEEVLEHGAGAYAGVDFSEPMLDLARARLERFDAPVELICGDFLEVPLEGPFEVVLALGLFDYLPDAPPFVRRMRELCSGTVVASFPGWHWFKGPIRRLRYEVVNKVRIFDYTEAGLRRIFADAGFERVELVRPGRSGFVARAVV